MNYWAMDNLKVVTIRLGDLLDNPQILKEYVDPHCYLKPYTRDWVGYIRKNPWVQEEDILLILTLDGRSVVGELGLIPSLAILNGTIKIRVFWLCSFFLQDAYKNSGAGGVMLLKAMSFSKNLLACGAPREDACRLYRGTGFEELGPLKRYVYFYNAGIIIERLVGSNYIAKTFAFPAGFLLNLYYKAKSPKRRTSVLTFRRVKFFSEELNQIFKGCRRSYFLKDSSFLNWLLEYKQQLYPFEIRRANKLIGYLLLRRSHNKGGGLHNPPEMEEGALLDYFLTEDDKQIKLEVVKFAIDYFEDSGIDVLEFQSIDKDFFEICSDLGMIHLGGNKTFLRLAKDARLSSMGEWFFTHGTADSIL